jgi:hypothetical protein
MLLWEFVQEEDRNSPTGKGAVKRIADDSGLTYNTVHRLSRKPPPGQRPPSMHRDTALQLLPALQGKVSEAELLRGKRDEEPDDVVRTGSDG